MAFLAPAPSLHSGHGITESCSCELTPPAQPHSGATADLNEYIVDVPRFYSICRAVVAACAFYLVLHTPQTIYYTFKYHQFRVEFERERRTVDPIRMFISEVHRQERRYARVAMQRRWRHFYESFEFAGQLSAFLDYSLKFLVYLLFVPYVRHQWCRALCTPCRAVRRITKWCGRLCCRSSGSGAAELAVEAAQEERTSTTTAEERRRSSDGKTLLDVGEVKPDDSEAILTV